MIVAIDDVFDKKMDAVDALPSQVYEGGASGSAAVHEARFPAMPSAAEPGRSRTMASATPRVADKYRDALVKWYGAQRGKAVKYAEAFEICEYGRRPSDEELRKLFPFFD